MKTNLNKEESGRSMVEMLGVLAVIGVLSITGISGYTTAMNKHKANEILDAASKRAVAVSTQIQRGSTSPTLGEFDDNEVGGAIFDEEVITSNGQFTIGYTLTNDDVRKQIKSIAGTDGIIRGITDSGFIYNNDLTADARASDFDGSESNCDTTKYTYCSATGKCIAGVSQTCPESCASAYAGSKTKTDAGTGAKQIGNTSCYCPANTKWNGTECKSTAPYVAGAQGCHYGCDTSTDLSNEAGTDERDDICPEDYHWATKGEFDTLQADGKFPIYGDGKYYWLKNCYQDGCTSGEAWCVYDFGVASISHRGIKDYALCVR